MVKLIQRTAYFQAIKKDKCQNKIAKLDTELIVIFQASKILGYLFYWIDSIFIFTHTEKNLQVTM